MICKCIYTQLSIAIVCAHLNSFKYCYLKLIGFNGFKYCYQTQTIQFNISHLFAHDLIVKQFYLTYR